MDADLGHRAAVFAGAYGMSARQRHDLVPLARRMVHRFTETARSAAEADPVFRRLWEEGARDRLPRAQAWLGREAEAITARLSTA